MDDGAQDVEAGFSGSGATFTLYPSSSTNMRRRGSYKATVGSPPHNRSGAAAAVFFCDGFSDEEPRHFLDSCFLCKTHLAGNHDIFMYRGDTPFCSEECRQQQIEMDEAREKKWKRITSTKNREQQGHRHQPVRVS